MATPKTPTAAQRAGIIASALAAALAAPFHRPDSPRAAARRTAERAKADAMRVAADQPGPHRRG